VVVVVVLLAVVDTLAERRVKFGNDLIWLLVLLVVDYIAWIYSLFF
jgi:hypothetical protein